VDLGGRGGDKFGVQMSITYYYYIGNERDIECDWIRRRELL